MLIEKLDTETYDEFADRIRNELLPALENAITKKAPPQPDKIDIASMLCDKVIDLDAVFDGCAWRPVMVVGSYVVPGAIAKTTLQIARAEAYGIVGWRVEENGISCRGIALTARRALIMAADRIGNCGTF